MCNQAKIFALKMQDQKHLDKVKKQLEKKNDLSLKIGQGACGWVAENKKISIIDDIQYAENYYPLRDQTQSQVALPLIIHDDILGVICLEKNEKSYFTNNIIEIFNIFANQAAIAFHRAEACDQQAQA